MPSEVLKQSYMFDAQALYVSPRLFLSGGITELARKLLRAATLLYQKAIREPIDLSQLFKIKHVLYHLAVLT